MILACFKSYDPIIDQNSRIILCKYNLQYNDDNTTIIETNKIYYTNFNEENQIETTIEKISEKTQEIKSDLETEIFNEKTKEL